MSAFQHQWVRLAFIVLFAAIVAGCMGEDPARITSDAISSGDPQACQAISDPRMKNNCSMYVSFSQDNITMCKAIEDRGWRNYCIMEIAKDRGDHKICDNIPTQRIKEDCLKGVGTRRKT